MITQRFYFDTSVIGGVYDSEFEEDSIQIFEKVKLGQVICVYSDLTEGELHEAPEKVKAFFRNLKREHIEIVSVNLSNGYQTLEIRSPKDIIGYEK